MDVIGITTGWRCLHQGTGMTAATDVLDNLAPPMERSAARGPFTFLLRSFMGPLPFR